MLSGKFCYGSFLRCQKAMASGGEGVTMMESGWVEIILQEITRVGVAELAKFGVAKISDLLRKQRSQDPAGEWIAIGARVFEGPGLTLIFEDVEEIPPLLEQAALAESRSEGTRLNRGYFEARVSGKFHEYWAVGLPWIPNVDHPGVLQEPYSFPEELQGSLQRRAGIVYYSRVADSGRPFRGAMQEAGRLLR